MARSFSVQSAGGALALDGSQGVRARLAVRGTGMAPVQNQWFEGAGDGKSFRGGRTLARILDLPVRVYAPPGDWENRDLVRSRFANLARILSLPNAPARLTLDLDSGSEGGDKWWVDVVRTGGGDWDWDADTDGRSFIHSVFSFEAGDPYWTAEDQESKVISPVGVGLGLLGAGVSLAQLRVGSTAGFGETSILNTGDVQAYPVWTIEAPFSGFSLTSDTGETLVWVGNTAKATGYIQVDMKAGTVVDETGANRYAELDPAPQFWSVRPGTTVANVVMADAGGATRAAVVWNVRREVLF